MRLTSFLLLLGCVLAGAVGCHRSEESTASLPNPSRWSVQQSSMQAENWQFVVCSPDARLLAFVEELASRNPFGKAVSVIKCADYQPKLPALFLGDRLPQDLSQRMREDSAVARMLDLRPGELLILNNYLNPLTARDSMPATLTLYLSPDPDTLLHVLSGIDPGGGGGIFRSRWAYEYRMADGGITLGTYAEPGWTFARDEEVYLAPIGPAVYTSQQTDYFAVDVEWSPEQLADIAGFVNDQLQKDGAVRRVFMYPSVERIGLRRGDMDPIQREGMDLHLVAGEALPGTRSRTAADHAFLAGMTLAHEGYRVYNGYGGAGVGPSLDSLCRMHVNAVAVVPYTFMRSGNEMTELPVPDDAGSENDPAVRHAIRRARERGMFVLLKPQIWVGGGWPGDIHFEKENEWDRFFGEYTSWIGHYAQMAEEEGVEALCIGTELLQTTLTHPEEWRQLIRAIRSVYSGKLTYAANWGTEFENVTFWADLDAIGLNGYYPLAGSQNPSDGELRAGASRWMKLADSISRAYDRPLWLTEVGYRSVEGAWTNPHAESADRSASYEAQARCYQALLFAAGASDRLKGMFVWKWPSYLGHREGRGEANSGYVPGGKPAGALLQAYYGQQ